MTKEALSTVRALKLALEALEEAADAIDSWGSYASGYFQVKHDLEGDISKAKSVITAIKEALAQPEQEPVTWRYKIVDVFGRPAWTLKTPKSDTRVLESQPLYTTPPQRTWVGLSHEEVITMSRYDLEYAALIGEVQRRLKEKNT